MINKNLLISSNCSAKNIVIFVNLVKGNVKAGWAVILSVEAERENGLPRAGPNCIQPSFKLYSDVFVQIEEKNSNLKTKFVKMGCSKLHTTIIQIVF